MGIVGILFFVAMVFTVVIVAFYPQFMTQAVDASGAYDNIDKKTEVMQVNDVNEDDGDKELVKKNDDDKNVDADKKYEALINNKQEIELAEEVNPEKAKENQTGSIEEEEDVQQDEKKEEDMDKKVEDEIEKTEDAEKEKSDFVDFPLP